MSLPTEIFVNIFHNVPVVYRAGLAMTCRTIAIMAEEHDLLWCDPNETALIHHIDSVMDPGCEVCTQPDSEHESSFRRSSKGRGCCGRDWPVSGRYQRGGSRR